MSAKPDKLVAAKLERMRVKRDKAVKQAEWLEQYVHGLEEIQYYKRISSDQCLRRKLCDVSAEGRTMFCGIKATHSYQFTPQGGRTIYTHYLCSRHYSIVPRIPEATYKLVERRKAKPAEVAE